MGLSIDELEALQRPHPRSGMIPLRGVQEHRFPGESYPGAHDAHPQHTGKMTVMGPVRPPGWQTDWKCGINHFDLTCTCTPPRISRPAHAETATASGRYVIGALHKVPVLGQLSQEDLDFLAWSCAKMAAHWGRLALGQEELV